MKLDYHIHSENSWDARGTYDDYCLNAIRIGIDEIGFSDHIDLDPIDRAFGFHDFEKIDRQINQVKERYAGKLIIKKGIEITYQEEFHDQIVDFMEKWNFDYSLVGIHLSKGIFYTSHLSEEQFVQFKDARSAYKFYFEELLRAVNSGTSDIVAHLDVLKRHGTKVFGLFNPMDFESEFMEILQAMVERHIALEINSGNIAHNRNSELYPSDWLIQRYRDLGGELITFGSDSHRPDALFGGYEIALATAMKFGFPGWTSYSKRKPEIVPFE